MPNTPARGDWTNGLWIFIHLIRVVELVAVVLHHEGDEALLRATKK